VGLPIDRILDDREVTLLLFLMRRFLLREPPLTASAKGDRSGSLRVYPDRMSLFGISLAFSPNSSSPSSGSFQSPTLMTETRAVDATIALFIERHSLAPLPLDGLWAEECDFRRMAFFLFSSFPVRVPPFPLSPRRGSFLPDAHEAGEVQRSGARFRLWF